MKEGVLFYEEKEKSSLAFVCIFFYSFAGGLPLKCFSQHLFFSEYPETESKQRLLTAYPKEYWKLSSFRGEIYGVLNSLSDFIKRKNYLMLNLDAAEQAGIKIPEKQDVLNLDGLLQQAENEGIPEIEWVDKLAEEINKAHGLD